MADDFKTTTDSDPVFTEYNKPKTVVEKKRKLDLEECKDAPEPSDDPSAKKLKATYGYLGSSDHKNFTGGLPKYIEPICFQSLVAKLQSNRGKDVVNPYAVGLFDIAGVGKTTFFKEAAKQAGAYCFIINGATGPFEGIFDACQHVIEKHFIDDLYCPDYKMHVLEDIIKHAFAIAFTDIKEILTKGGKDTCYTLTRNGLLDAVKSGNKPKPHELLEEIGGLLKGRSAIILNDDFQFLTSHLARTDIRHWNLPQRVFQEYDQELHRFSWKDFILLRFHSQLGGLIVVGGRNNILFCQTGTHNFTYLYYRGCGPGLVLSAQGFDLFGLQKCTQLFDHYWRFKITEEEKDDLLRQLLGPPKLMEYFFKEIVNIQKSPEDVTFADLQLAVDGVITTLENDIRQRLDGDEKAYENYVRVVLYPEDHGGELMYGKLDYEEHSEGWHIIQEYENIFSNAGVLRVEFGDFGQYFLKTTSRASQLAMCRSFFTTEQFKQILAVLDSKKRVRVTSFSEKGNSLKDRDTFLDRNDTHDWLTECGRTRMVIKHFHERFIGKPARRVQPNDTEAVHGTLLLLENVIARNLLDKLRVVVNAYHPKRKPLRRLLSSGRSLDLIKTVAETDPWWTNVNL